MAANESKFINRELSWLEFNQRVLDEALDSSVPLLDRLNFLAITGSNLDEFFMVRVGGLEMLLERGISKPDPSGMKPREQLENIGERVAQMVACQYACYLEDLEPALAAEGIVRVRPETLTGGRHDFLTNYFENCLVPLLTPMAVERPADFPLLVNLGLNIAVRLKPAAGARRARFAIIPVGPAIKRFLPVPGEADYNYIPVEDVLILFADRFFPGQAVLEAAPFRITRNADLSVREDMAADLMAEMEAVLTARKRGECVRLEISESASKGLASFLRRALRVRETNVYRLNGPLDISALRRIATVEGFDRLRYETWEPQPSPGIDRGKSIFENVAKKNVLLSLPYESFEPVVRLLEEAARDPDVLAIKQILYRTNAGSRIIAALGEAARQGKNVTVIVELKARFDEARNIAWARALEEDGVQVIYGIKGLKTHAKLCIVVRREPEGIIRYLHFGTGNYNENTARLYSDVGYFTRDDELGADATKFFNSICGYSEPQSFLKLAAAPLTLRARLLELIADETERAARGQKGRIIAKINSLACPEIIEMLYKASKAGVEIKLNVRGICCLRPGVPGLSDNIEVVSIIDRFLEHSRILYFHHGGERRIFISSADWMPRNLDRRIELLVPVEDSACRKALLRILGNYFADNTKSRRILGDGSYARPEPPGSRRKAVRAQAALYQEAVEAARTVRLARPTSFEPHLPAG